MRHPFSADARHALRHVGRRQEDTRASARNGSPTQRARSVLARMPVLHFSVGFFTAAEWCVPALRVPLVHILNKPLWWCGGGSPVSSPVSAWVDPAQPLSGRPPSEPDTRAGQTHLATDPGPQPRRTPPAPRTAPSLGFGTQLLSFRPLVIPPAGNLSVCQFGI